MLVSFHYLKFKHLAHTVVHTFDNNQQYTNVRFSKALTVAEVYQIILKRLLLQTAEQGLVYKQYAV